MKNFVISTVFVSGVFLLVISCNRKKVQVPANRLSNKIDTLIVEFMACTECDDAYVLGGTLNIPATSKTPLFSNRDIVLEGEDPFNDEDNWNKKIELYGYAYRIDSANGKGKLLSFWVVDWKIIGKKDR